MEISSVISPLLKLAIIKNMKITNILARNKNISRFIEHIRSTVESSGVKFVLAPVKYLVLSSEGYIRCNGYFDSEKLDLKCAINKPILEWIPILVHEYSHFEQWKENCPSWRHIEINGQDISDDMFLWISGKRVVNSRLRKIISKVRNCELDCEKRAVQIIHKFKLPIDVHHYIQSSNAYIYFHEYIYLTRQWYKDGKAPYNIDKIVSEMPLRFLNRYDKLPKKYRILFDKYCT